MLYSWCDTVDCRSLNFDSSAQRTLFHCSIVQSLCTLASWSLLILFCFLNSSSAISASFTESSPYCGCLHIFLTTLVQLCSDIWNSQPSVTQAGDSVVVLCIEKTGSILQAVIQHIIVKCEFKCGGIMYLFENILFILSTKKEKCLQMNFSKDIWLY